MCTCVLQDRCLSQWREASATVDEAVEMTLLAFITYRESP